MKKANATGTNMRGKLTFFMLIFAMLFGTVIMPTIAHAQAAATGHGAEVSDNHEHDASTEQDSQKSDADKPCHTVAHHHCAAALRVDATALAPALIMAQLAGVPLSSVKMSSLSQAPPTEPPAA